MDILLSSPSHTYRLGRSIGRVLQGGDVLALIGDLGTGKTTLIREIAVGLGAPADLVSSPTFLLAHEYRGRLPFFHLDLYRLRTVAEAEAAGLSAYFTDSSAIAIEWANRLPPLLPGDRLEIRLSHRTPLTRDAALRATGPRSAGLLSRIRASRLLRSRAPASSRPKVLNRRKALGR